MNMVATKYILLHLLVIFSISFESKHDLAFMVKSLIVHSLNIFVSINKQQYTDLFLLKTNT